ncbi:MAG TPA: DUF2752 domain-containing protein [Acidobacteriaceae bacterium]|nr:DUF2752 domain-containing protein [Acidobacteriaceae bacterium]
MEIDIIPRRFVAMLPLSDEAASHLTTFLSNLLALLGAPLLIHIPHFCVMQRLFHIPCPGCGILHGITAILHGHFELAGQSNPAAFAVAAFFVFQIVARPMAMAFPNTRPLTTQLSRYGSAVVLVCLSLAWLLRLTFGGSANGIRFLS